MAAKSKYLSLLLAAGAAVTGCATPDGVWDVVSIDQQINGSWQGVDEDGEHIGGAIWICTAKCRDGSQTQTIVLESGHHNPVNVADLPLQTGDRFQFSDVRDTSQDALTIELPDGVVVRKLAAGEISAQSEQD